MRLKNLKILKTLVFIGVFAILTGQLTCYAIAENKLVFKSYSNDQMKIALTFDDGPHPRKTDEILNILDEYGIKATFFVVGVNAVNYPHALRNVVSKGHEIGNHTFSHKILKSLSSNAIQNELFNAEDALYDLCLFKPTLLRPPCGLFDSTLVRIADENNYKIVLWTIDTKDWAHESVDSIVKNVLSNIKSGDIILFHDYISGVDNTPSALRVIIPKLQEMGYKFVTVGELLQS